jgi:hypothetical protein
MTPVPSQEEAIRMLDEQDVIYCFGIHEFHSVNAPCTQPHLWPAVCDACGMYQIECDARLGNP